METRVYIGENINRCYSLYDAALIKVKRQRSDIRPFADALGLILFALIIEKANSRVNSSAKYPFIC